MHIPMQRHQLRVVDRLGDPGARPCLRGKRIRWLRLRACADRQSRYRRHRKTLQSLTKGYFHEVSGSASVMARERTCVGHIAFSDDNPHHKVARAVVKMSTGLMG